MHYYLLYKFGKIFIITWDISCFSHFCSQIPDKNQLKLGVFILDLLVEGIQSTMAENWWLQEGDSAGYTAHKQGSREVRENEVRQLHSQEPSPSIKVPPPKGNTAFHNSTLFLGTKCSNTWGFGGHFTFKLKTVSSYNTRHFS